MSKKIILAGVARSGSTLACYLINKLPDAVALLEPIAPSDFANLENGNAISFLNDFFAQQELLIVNNGVADSKSVSGSVPDNLIGEEYDKSGRRQAVLDDNQIIINKTLPDDFSLIVKQPGIFSGKLNLLKDYFECYATIRNPLSILQSWNTVDLPVKDGRAPAAELCDPVLAKNLQKEPSLFKRQLILLSWYFEQFYYYLPEKNIIRYEDVIASGGKSLSNISLSASGLNENLVSKNENPLYNSDLREKLRSLILESDGYYWKYYSMDDI